MPTFVTLVNFTDQGARAIQSSPDRFEAYKQLAEAAGITVRNVLWTEGAHDMVLVTEGPEEAVLVTAMKLASLGNVRTQTMRGHSLQEMRQFVERLG